MVFFNYSTMQMAAKVVYYGPGLCGKTTNLQWIFDHTSTDSRGEMVSLATETDRTLFFDLLPIDVGTIAGFNTRIQLYTVPGQVFYNTTRKLVLKGVDGVVFVADSQRPMLQANIDSFANLEENLGEMGLTLETIPVVLQYNKRDLPNVLSVEELNEALNRADWPYAEACALTGEGVLETLKLVSKSTLLALKKRLTKGRSEGGRTAPPPRPMSPKPPLKPPLPPKPAAAPKPASAPEGSAKSGLPRTARPPLPAAPPPRPTVAAPPSSGEEGLAQASSAAPPLQARLDEVKLEEKPPKAESPTPEIGSSAPEDLASGAGPGSAVEEPLFSPQPTPAGEASPAEMADAAGTLEPEENLSAPVPAAESPVAEPSFESSEPEFEPLELTEKPVELEPVSFEAEPVAIEEQALPEMADGPETTPEGDQVDLLASALSSPTPAAAESRDEFLSSETDFEPTDTGLSVSEPEPSTPVPEPSVSTPEPFESLLESPAPAPEPTLSTAPAPVPAPEPLPLSAPEPLPLSAPEPVAPVPEPVLSTLEPPAPESKVPASDPAPLQAPEQPQTVSAPTPTSPLASSDPRSSLTASLLAREEPPRRRKPRLGGIDALAELEKLRQEALQPKPERRVSRNGQEIRRELEFDLARADLRRAHRFSLTLQLEDQDRKPLDEAHQVLVDIEDASALEKLMLRLNIALNAKEA